MKELPYFRFTCQEWDSGDISLENYSTKGLFVDICSYYWLQNCDVSLAKLRQKVAKWLTKGHQMADKRLKDLSKRGIIKIEGDKVSIHFLDEQLAEITVKSNKLSEAGKRGVEERERRKQATLKPPLSIKDKDKDKDKEKDNTLSSQKLVLISKSKFPYMTDKNFEAEFKEYLKTRKKATPRARELLLIKLHEYKPETAVLMIRQSIEKGWTGIFPLKNETMNNDQPQTFNERDEQNLIDQMNDINTGYNNAKSREYLEPNKNRNPEIGDIEDVSGL